MVANVGLISYLGALIAYASLSILLIVSWRGRPFGGILIVATALTAIWAAVVATGTLLEYPPIAAMKILEVLRNAGWIFFLLQLTSLRFDGEKNSLGGRHWLPIFGIGVSLVMALLLLAPHISDYVNVHEDIDQDLTFAIWLAISILGLLLLEQVFRNATEPERWSIKYLCFGLGSLFAYDFAMYAEALLFRQLDQQLWQARGIINALGAPLLAIAIARNTNWKLDLHVSRQVVFHTVTLSGAGIYLVLMAVVGYFLKLMDGTWGGVLQISFLAATGVLLLTLFFSGKIRANVRVFLSKHFFSYKYDYREEWLKFTQTLADINDHVPEGVTGAMASLVSSPAGLLYCPDETDQFKLVSHWKMPAPENDGDMAGLPAWLDGSGWVIDIDELKRDPEIYNNLVLPTWLDHVSGAWLVVPMLFGEKLQGILILRRSELQQSINWEDRDLLKTAGRQAASVLAQHLASEELIEAKQFDAFNRLSAYVIHDLKNILAQQSLMVSNAQKHKHNPDFVDDMIATVGNSVDRMTKLMDQMRSGVRGSVLAPVDLKQLILDVVESRSRHEPKPVASLENEALSIETDRERLQTVFGHLIQNAQEASERTGRVEIRVRRENNHALIEIEDDGKGMDEHFVKTRLFKPFDSTKGLTGMGIGVFESREFIRSLGGDIKVSSSIGEGSVFRVLIPCKPPVEKIGAQE